MTTVLRFVIKLFFGIFLFVGLPLIGWGVTEMHSYFSDPARMYYIIITILIQIIILIWLPQVGVTEKKTTPLQRLSLVPLQVIPLALVIAAPYSDHRNIAVVKSEFIRYAGLALFSFGFIFMHWAQASLGKQFSIYVKLQDDHKLVSNGLYRHVRHPRYLGIILFTTGIAFVFRSWMALILVAILIMVLLWRIHEEESLMSQEFGKDWTEYCRKSWRMIPLIY
jgi:protein-S-isoprenylcysteine O-methyltransferase Ste14